jgi:hypothetical protein
MVDKPPRGVRIALSPVRKVALELFHHARKLPSLPLSRVLHVPEVVAARHKHPEPPSWIAIFMKAYGLVAQGHPELRRAYIPWPWPHFYEHPQSECALLVEREWQGEQVLLGATIAGPEKQSLEAIGSHLRYLKQAEVLKVRPFREILRLGRLPAFLRRLILSRFLYLSGYLRARRLGTFIISSLGNFGVEQHHPLTPLTTYLTFGPISLTGEVTAKIIYDHRVMDGRKVAHCLVDLESILRTDLVRELAADRRQVA